MMIKRIICNISGYNMGIDMIDPLVIRGEQRSYETGVYIMPLEHTWGDKSQVLVQTPVRNYTVQDYGSFFDDIGFSQGKEMMENVLDFVNLTHPGVNTFCIYSLGIETPEKLVYNVSIYREKEFISIEIHQFPVWVS